MSTRAEFVAARRRPAGRAGAGRLCRAAFRSRMADHLCRRRPDRRRADLPCRHGAARRDRHCQAAGVGPAAGRPDLADGRRGQRRARARARARRSARGGRAATAERRDRGQAISACSATSSSTLPRQTLHADAPVTVQFWIQNHPLAHAYRHLAAALARGAQRAGVIGFAYPAARGRITSTTAARITPMPSRPCAPDLLAGQAHAQQHRHHRVDIRKAAR